MRSDAEFYRGEYLRCCELYRECPPEKTRLRKLYSHMSTSMLNAYIDAVFTKKQCRAEKCPAERSELW